MSAMVSFSWCKNRAPKGDEFLPWLHFAYGTLAAGGRVVMAANGEHGASPALPLADYVRQFGDDVPPEKTNVKSLEDWKTSTNGNFILRACDNAKVELAKHATWTASRWKHGLIQLPNSCVDLTGFEVWPMRAAPPRPRVSPQPARLLRARRKSLGGSRLRSSLFTRRG
jgi:hypothetical protein|tara:strand:- start:306 stop:812 length:507 start_codon:yes stop_codon:yes gene_type:complete